MTYIDINGIRTWYDEHGQGDPLVLLHGGFVGSFSWANTGIVEALSPHFRVISYDRRAHGYTDDPGGPITYSAMTQDAVAFVEAVVGGPAHLVGYSDGAIISMMVALARPDLIRNLGLLTGNFHYSGLITEGVDWSQTGAALAPWYDANSPSGPGHAQDLVARLSEEFAQRPTMTVEDLSRIRARTLVMAADDDVIYLEHFIEEYRAIPGAELAILPGTSHTFASEKPALMNAILVDFFTNEPVPTRLPIRRRTSP